MTLIVHAYRRHPKTGRMIDLETKPVPPCNDLAGFESWRRNVWGAQVMKALGLVLIPSLAKEDIYAEGTGLDRLEIETDVLLKNLKVLAQATGFDEESLRFRIDNVREAVRLAREVEQGGVYIG